MDLNPDALLPSARRPFIPNTERSEILKIYGDADVTVSIVNETDDPDTEGSATEGEF